jgi:hypothetical protein
MSELYVCDEGHWHEGRMPDQVPCPRRDTTHRSGKGGA